MGVVKKEIARDLDRENFELRKKNRALQRELDELKLRLNSLESMGRDVLVELESKLDALTEYSREALALIKQQASGAYIVLIRELGHPPFSMQKKKGSAGR